MDFRNVYSSPVSVDDHYRIKASYANFYGYLENFEMPSPHRIISDHIWVNDSGVKPYYLKPRKLVVFKRTGENEVEAGAVIPFGFFLNGNLKPGDLLAGKVDKCPYQYLKSLTAEDKKFVFFIPARPQRAEKIERLPSNWQEGIIFNEKLLIPLGEGNSFAVLFQKRYIRTLGQTVCLLTNLEKIPSGLIESVAENFPFSL